MKNNKLPAKSATIKNPNIKVRKHYDEWGNVQATCLFTETEILEVYDGNHSSIYDK